MQPINPSRSSLNAQRALTSINRQWLQSLQRVSTGQRINRAADDPSGLIASENLRAVLADLEAESDSLQRVDHVASTADAAIGEMSDLLTEARGLAVAAANTAGVSDEERQALQMELDSVISSIDRMAQSTSFNGDRLLDGTATLTANGVTGLVQYWTGSHGFGPYLKKFREDSAGRAAPASTLQLAATTTTQQLGLHNE